MDGRHFTTLKGPDIAKDFLEILDRYVEGRSQEKNTEYRIQKSEVKS